MMLLSFTTACSQSKVTGQVYDKYNSESLSGVSVQLFSKTKLIDFSFSDETGHFYLALPKEGNYLIRYSSLGYSTEIDSITFNLTNQKIIKYLVPSDQIIEEIVIKGNNPIQNKGDTIVLNADYFRRGNENKVRDLLNNLPNVNVNEDGIIKVGGKKIEHLLIEGDDLLGKAYNIISSNMKEDVVKEVEILKDYEKNQLLDSFHQSDKIAINLVLYDNAKSTVFGNFKPGVSLNDIEKHRVDGHIMNISKNLKAAYFGNKNNVGFFASKNLKSLLNSPSSKVNLKYNTSNYTQNTFLKNTNLRMLKDERTNRNNDFFNAGVGIFNLSDNLTAKASIIYDNKGYNSLSEKRSTFSNLSYNSKKDFRSKNKNYYTNLGIVYEKDKSSNFFLNVSLNELSLKSNAKTKFNLPYTEGIELPSESIFFETGYTSKINENNIIELVYNHNWEKANESYYSTNFNFNNFYDFLISDISSYQQHIFNKTKTSHTTLNLYHKLGNNDQLDLSFRLKGHKEFNNVELIDEIQNLKIDSSNTNFDYNQIISVAKYHTDLYNINVITSIVLQATDSKQFDNGLRLLPTLNLQYDLNEKNEIFLFLTRNTSLPTINDIRKGSLIRSHNVLSSQGSENAGPFLQDFAILKYSVEGWGEDLFVNTQISYSKAHKYFTSDYSVFENYTVTKTLIDDDFYLISGMANVDKYLNSINSNLSLDLKYSFNELENSFNGNFQSVQSNNYRLGLELRSAWIETPFDFNIGGSISKTVVNSITGGKYFSQNGFIDLYYQKPSFNLLLQSEYYQLPGNNSNQLYFIDLVYEHKLIEDKLFLNLIFNNILNQKYIETETINSISSLHQYTNILPRILLTSIDWSF